MAGLLEGSLVGPEIVLAAAALAAHGVIKQVMWKSSTCYTQDRITFSHYILPQITSNVHPPTR